MHDGAEDIHIVGEFSLFHHIADEVAKDSAEVLMTRVGEQAAGVGQHADETGQIALRSQ